MLRTPSRELGSYVLEVAGVVMGLGIFILGAADVTRVFQARSAVRAAVNDGARCLFPTDAACVSRGASTFTPGSRRFDVWVWGTGYQIPQESFTASAQWQREPVYETNILKRSVKDVVVEHDQFQYGSRQVLYPTESNTPYLLQTRFMPVATGGSGLNPQFSDPLTLKNVRSHAEYSLSGISGEVSTKTGAKKGERIKIGIVNIDLSDAWSTAKEDKVAIAALGKSYASSLPCYAGYTKGVNSSVSLDWGTIRPTECRYRIFQDIWKDSSQWTTFGGGATTSPKLWDGSTLLVPLLFHVTGSPKDSAHEANGRLSIVMSWRNASSSGVQELGGRVLEEGSSGNLISRGLPEEDIKPDIRKAYESYTTELSDYGQLPLVPHDARVTIHFYLETANGLPVNWRGTTLKVFYPQFRFVHEKKDCGYTSNPKACVEKPKNVPITFVSLKDGEPLRAKQLGVDSCSLDARADAETSEREALRKVQEAIKKGASPAPASFVVKVPTDRNVCAPRTSTVPCVGVATTEYVEGCEPIELASKTASSCQVDTERFPAATLVKVTMGDPIQRTQRTRGCSDAPLPACARPFARVVEKISYNPTAGQAQCDAADSSKGAQLVFGPFVASQCVDRTSEIVDLYRANEKIPQDVPVSVVRAPAPPLYSREKPGGNCIAYQAASADSGDIVCGLNLSSFEADRCCEENGGRCRRREVATTDEGAPGWEAGLLAAARQRVVDAVRAAYPPARSQDGCGSEDADCLQTEATLGDGRETATVSAKVHVPLRLLEVIGSSPVTVEHSVTRRMERTHLG